MEWNCNITITNLSLQALGTFSSSSFLERDIKRFLVPWGKKFLLNIKFKSMNISLKTNLSFKNVTIWTNSHVCQWLYLWHLLLKNIVLAIIFNHCSIFCSLIWIKCYSPSTSEPSMLLKGEWRLQNLHHIRTSEA